MWVSSLRSLQKCWKDNLRNSLINDVPRTLYTNLKATALKETLQETDLWSVNTNSFMCTVEHNAISENQVQFIFINTAANHNNSHLKAEDPTVIQRQNRDKTPAIT